MRRLWANKIYKIKPDDSDTTSFFRYPGQLRFLVEQIRRLSPMASKQKPIRILLIGASIGAEAYSLMMMLDQDYQKNSKSWGKIHPSQKVEIVATDLDESAVEYAARGQYVAHRDLIFSDTFTLKEYAQDLGIPLDPYFHFDGKNTYRVKIKWKSWLKTTTLDVLNVNHFLAQNGRFDFVLYNMVDGHIEGTESRKKAAENVMAISSHFVVTVPRIPETLDPIKGKMVFISQEGPSYHFSTNR